MTDGARMRALVLGGSGFLGRQVGARLAGEGYDVVGLARRAAEVPGVRMVRVDLASPEGARVVADLRPGLVVNAAGALWGGVTEEQMRDSNVRLVENVLAALAGTTARFVHFGTVHEYGDVASGVRLAESVPCAPVAPYGRTKLLATEAVRKAAGSGAVDAVVLRLANVLGPGIPADSLPGKVAAALARASAAGETARLDLYPLRSARDFLDVRDLLDALVAAIKAEVPGHVLTVGSGTAVDVRELVTDLVAVSGVPARLVERAVQGGPSPRSALGRQEVDPAPAAALLGWRARYTTADALRTLWESVRP